jgi:hypothetical protein
VAHPQIAVFARLADGQANRVRAIEGQKTLLSRTMHGIAYDEVHDEIYVTQQFGQGILVFRGGANGEEPPMRVINGSKTQLIEPDNLVVDPVHDEIFVPEGEKILVYPRTANGNVAPIRTITGFGTVSGIAVDPQRDLIIASTQDYDWEVEGKARGDDASRNPRGQSAPSSARLSIYPRTANGHHKPARVITGWPTGRLVHYPPLGLVFMMQKRSFMGVWHIDDESNAPPRFTFGGPGFFGRGMGVAIDPKHQSVILSDKDLNAVLTFQVPEVFDRRSTASSK